MILKLSLKTKLMLIFVSVFIVFTSLGSFLYINTYNKRIKELMFSKLNGLSSIFMDIIDELMSYGLNINEMKGMDDKLSKFVKDNFDINNSGIVSTEGKFIYHSNPNLIGSDFNEITGEDLSVLRFKSISLYYSKYDNCYIYAITDPIYDEFGNQSGALRIGMSEEILTDARQKIILNIFIFAGIFLLIFISSISISSRVFVTSPLNKFLKTIKIPLSQVELRTGDELEELAVAYNNMAEKLKKTLKSLNQQIQERMATEEELRVAYDELNNAQVQLIQSEKMAAIGQLAAGVAHEINNPTSFIINNLDVLDVYVKKIIYVISKFEDRMDKITKSNKPEIHDILTEDDDQTEKDINIKAISEDLLPLISETLDGARRIKKIVGNLRSFAHPTNDDWQETDINEEVNKAIDLVWNEIKHKAKVEKEFGSIPKVVCNPGQLVQVFVNIIMNAVYVIEKDGFIKIKTYSQPRNVIIEITDNGKGISENNIKKIFDPFFTTKKVGQGTGLGLSIVYNIIRQHHGGISVNSKEGEGTKFTIRLPVDRYDA